MEKIRILQCLVALSLLQVALCQKFQVMPRDVAVKMGASARFNCTVTPSVVSSEDLEWWQRGSPDFAPDVRIMSTVYNRPVPAGYEIEKDEANGRYDLIISNVERKHIANFECLLGLSTEKQAASLTVVEQVGCSKRPTGNEIPDTAEASLTCSVRYLGSRTPDLEWKSTVGGIMGKHASEELHPDGFRTLRAVANFTASSDYDDSKTVCEMDFRQTVAGDLPPSYEDSCELDIFVEHAVSVVLIEPTNQFEFIVGSVLDCSGNGRPEPKIMWSNLNDGSFLEQVELTVEAEMIGVLQKWQCIVTNTISGTDFTKDANITFTVKGASSVEGPGATQGWQVAVGVVVSLVVIIIVAVIVAVIFMRRKKQQQAKDSEVPEKAPESKGIPPDTRYAEENQAYASSMGELNKKPPAPYNGHPQNNPQMVRELDARLLGRQVQMNPDPSGKYEPGQVSRHSSASNISQASIGQEVPDVMGVMGQSYGPNKPAARGPPLSQPPRQYYDNTPQGPHGPPHAQVMPPDAHAAPRPGGTDV